MIHLRPIPLEPPASAWRDWVKDILAGLGLLAFMVAAFWAFAKIADMLGAIGWVS